jgi:hypothetical protein
VAWRGVGRVGSTRPLEQTRVIVVVVGVIVVLRTPLASLALLPLVPGSESLGRLMVILAYEVLVIPVSSARDKTISALPNSNLELNRLPDPTPSPVFASNPVPLQLRLLSDPFPSPIPPPLRSLSDSSPRPPGSRTHVPVPLTPQITSHLERLQTVEKELAAIKSTAAPKDDVAKVRGEMKKVYVSAREVWASLGRQSRVKRGVLQWMSSCVMPPCPIRVFVPPPRLPFLAHTCPILSYFCPVLFHLVLSRPILSHPVPSGPILFNLAPSRPLGSAKPLIIWDAGLETAGHTAAALHLASSCLFALVASIHTLSFIVHHRYLNSAFPIPPYRPRPSYLSQRRPRRLQLERCVLSPVSPSSRLTRAYSRRTASTSSSSTSGRTCGAWSRTCRRWSRRVSGCGVMAASALGRRHDTVARDTITPQSRNSVLS